MEKLGVVSRSDAMLHDPTGDPCLQSWAVARHLSPTSCWRGFLALPPPHPFLETARPEAAEAETDRDLQISTDASHYSSVHEI